MRTSDRCPRNARQPRAVVRLAALLWSIASMGVAHAATATATTHASGDNTAVADGNGDVYRVDFVRLLVGGASSDGKAKRSRLPVRK